MSFFNWQRIAEIVLNKALQMILISVLFLILNQLGQYGIKKLMRHFIVSDRFSTNRISTFQSLMRNLLMYTLLVFYLYSLLNLIGVPVGTLVASAGIASLALGLGAQGFVNDMVTGFFILIERQFEVGDTVQLGTIKGTVHAVGLRTTQIRSADGTLNYIPNRNITVVSNLSRGYRSTTLTLPIDVHTNHTEIEGILQPVCEQLAQTNSDLIDVPQLLGFTEIEPGRFGYQITFTAKQGAELQLQRVLLRDCLEALAAHNISLVQTVPIPLHL